MDSPAHIALHWPGNLHYHHHSSFTTTKHPPNDSLEARITDSTLSISLNCDNYEEDDRQQQEEEGLQPLLLPRPSHHTPPPSSSSSANNDSVDDTKEHSSNNKTTTASSSPLPLPARIPRLSIARILAEAELMEEQQLQQQKRNLIRHPPTIAATGLPEPEYWITYGHGPDTLTSIKHTNSIVTRKLTSLANTPPSTAINHAKQHDLRLANAREASRAKKAADEATAIRENERVSQRLKAVKASSDVERQGLKKEYASQREIFKRLCRMSQRPIARA